MDRKERLMSHLCSTDEDKIIIEPVVDEMVFLENQLDSLRKLPFIKVHPQYPDLQKSTPAQKQYKELLQQYMNIVRILSKKDDNSDEGVSPLREWVKNHVHSS